ncbi:MAG: hypothetical protein CL931_01230 [Deltaproteobacteria bacterium]|nr:hypothetical protein [Deltaproteobacteria bacterium]
MGDLPGQGGQMTIEREGPAIAAEPSGVALGFILLRGLFPRVPFRAVPLVALWVLAIFSVATRAREVGHA